MSQPQTSKYAPPSRCDPTTVLLLIEAQADKVKAQDACKRAERQRARYKDERDNALEDAAENAKYKEKYRRARAVAILLAAVLFGLVAAWAQRHII